MFGQIMEYIRSQPSLVSQIKEALKFYEYEKLFEFVIDYKTLPENIQKWIKKTRDFNEFSTVFEDAVKSMCFEEDHECIDEVKHIVIYSRLKNFLFDTRNNSFPHLTLIRNINARRSLKKYLCFRGVVRTCTIPTAKIKRLKYECSECESEYIINFDNIDPSFKIDKCTHTKDCNGKLVFKDTIGTTTNFQEMQIEELSYDSTEKDPAHIELKIEGDLAGKFSIGDTVVVSGNMRLDTGKNSIGSVISRKLQDAEYSFGMKGLTGFVDGLGYQYFIEANYMEKINDNNILFSELSEDDIKTIKEMAKDPNFICKAIASFAPEIYGHEAVKEVLLYQAVGGLGRSLDPNIDKRGEIHVLLIGDPSTAKTDLMKAALSISHRSKFIDAGLMTKVGLAGGAVNGPGGEWVLTAGAAVYADRGVMGIDEFLDADTEVLNILKGIMEDQRVVIEKIKSGTFLSRVSMIMCGNPSNGGRYDRNKNFNENVKELRDSIISRFDAIFVFEDIPDPVKDPSIYDKMSEVYNGELKPPISKEMLAKYIYYVRNNVGAIRLSKEADEYIKEHFIGVRTQAFEKNIRNKDGGARYVPYTFRQSQSMRRLATARARFLMKDIADLQDAKETIKLFHEAFKFTLDKETNMPDSNLLFGKSSTIEQNRDKIFRDVMEQMADSFGNKVKIRDLMAALRTQELFRENEIAEDKLMDFIKKYDTKQYIDIVNNRISIRNYVGNVG